MSWISFVIILVLLASAYGGFRRGAAETLVALICYLIALTLGFLFYPYLSLLLESLFHISEGIGRLSSFLGIIIIAEIGLSLATEIIYRKIYSAKERRFIWNWDHWFGFIPGLIGGWLFIAILMLCLLVLPISGSVKDALNQSSLAKATSKSVGFLTNDIKDIFIPASNDAQLAIRNLNNALFPENYELTFKFPDNLNCQPDPKQEEEMLRLINLERTKNNLKPLIIDPSLRTIARQHSLEMFRLSYFDHNSPISGSPFDRMQAAGIRFVNAGENIAYAANLTSAHEGLMHSPKHRENILSNNFNYVGIGIINAGDWGDMYTQDFVGR